MTTFQKAEAALSKSTVKSTRKFKVAIRSVPVLAPVLAIVVFAIQANSQTQGVLGRDEVLNHLNAVIGWYKDCTTKVQPGQQPSDSIYQNNAEWAKK